MLRELARLASGMLVLHGHVVDVATLRRLAHGAGPADGGTHRGKPFRRRPGRDWRTPLELLLLGGIWGGSFLFLRIAAPALGPAPLVETRLVLGALVLAPFLWMARREIAALGWWKVAAIGLLNTLLPFLLFAWSAERAPAGISAIVNSMAVPFAALTAFALYGEHMGVRRIAGLLLGMAGVVVLAAGSVEGAGFGPAVAAGAAAAFLYGMSANLVKRHFAGLPPAAVAAATLACSAVLLAPFAAWQWPSGNVPGTVWLSVAALGVACTGIAYWIYFRLIQRVGAARATTVTYLVPLFGVLWAWLALGEPLTLAMALGGTLILGGMLYGRSRSRAAPAPHAGARRPAPKHACRGTPARRSDTLRA